MQRRLLVALGVAAYTSIGCGERAPNAPIEARVSDPGGDLAGAAPEVPTPTGVPQPTPSATPLVVAEKWQSAAALYLSLPADGVLRSVAELGCRDDGFCENLVCRADGVCPD